MPSKSRIAGFSGTAHTLLGAKTRKTRLFSGSSGLSGVAPDLVSVELIGIEPTASRVRF